MSDREPVRLRLMLLLAALTVLGTVVSRARADALDGVLEVRSAYVELVRSVYTLHARIAYPLTPAIRDALRDGVTLSFDLETHVDRERHLWFDANVVDVSMRRELSYNTVSDRYVVRDSRSGDLQSFPTLEEALGALGTVDDWPVAVEPQIVHGEHYRIAVRAGIRRGRMPSSLRVLLFWTNDWHRVSPWYTWSLPN